MTEKLKEAARDNWPMLALMTLLAGGSTGLTNLLANSGVADAREDYLSRLVSIESTVRDVNWKLDRQNSLSWTVDMEAEMSRTITRELRKANVNIDEPDARKIHKEQSR